MNLCLLHIVTILNIFISKKSLKDYTKYIVIVYLIFVLIF